jgi:hypothetical protein
VEIIQYASQDQRKIYILLHVRGLYDEKIIEQKNIRGKRNSWQKQWLAFGRHRNQQQQFEKRRNQLT